MDQNNAVLVKATCKILIIDDEGDVCYLLSKLLKQREFSLEQVNTLAQAQIILKEETPNIIFLDYNLPDGLGINFVDHVRENYPQIKIIMITAHDNAITKHRALKKGVDFFITKPFTSEQIYNCVDKLIS